VAQPTPYSRQYNFTNFQTVNPSTPLPAAQVDLELNTIKQTLDQTLNNLRLIQRDDTALANASVGLDQLKSEVTIGVNAPSPWVTSHAYIKNDTVITGGIFYICLVSHTSGTFATDLAALKWSLIADFTSIGFDLANAIHSGVAKTIPNDSDEFPQADSAAAWSLKKTTWANFKMAMFTAWGALMATGTGKTTPVNADAVVLMDSAAGNATKTLTWANLVAGVVSGLGVAIAALTGKVTPIAADSLVISDSAAAGVAKQVTLTNFWNTTLAAFGPLIAALTAKTIPVDGDGVALIDSAAANAPKFLSWANIKATLKTYFDTLYTGDEVVTASPSANQNNYAPGLSTSKRTPSNLILTPTATLKITGIDTTNWDTGKRLRIVNGTALTGANGRLIILERRSASSNAANRFEFSKEIRTHSPILLMPGEAAEFIYDGTNLKLISSKEVIWAPGHYKSASGVFGASTGTGTAAGGAGVTEFSTALNQIVNYVSFQSGTTAASVARLNWEFSTDNSLTLGGSCVVGINTVKVPVLSTGVDEFVVYTGLIDAGTDPVVDGVGFKYKRTTSTQWLLFAASNSTETTSATGLTVATTDYVLLGFFLNGDGTRLEGFYSTDGGETWTVSAAVITTNIPTGSARGTSLMSALIKTVGTGNVEARIETAKARMLN
jgi:hypothetical protein